MNKERIKRTGWTWKATGAVFSFTGGLLAALPGALLTAGAWITGAEIHPLLHNLGAGLLLATIPLLFFAGYCLDWMEQGEPKKSATGKSGDEARDAGKFSRVVALAGFFVLCAMPCELRAQQTIFNVPSTDVLDKGKVYGEFDASFKPNNSETVSRFSSFVPRIVVGLGGSVEIGLNVTGNIQPGADSTTLVPAVKWKVYQGKDNGIAIAVGDHVYFPVRNRGYNVGNYVYAEISKTFKSGTRLTAGGYDFTKNVVAASNRAGGQFGFEQPVNKKVAFAADYFTGKHAAGYFTPGFVFKFSPKTTGYAGYSIGNQNPLRGNNFFLLELGYNFN